MRLPERAGEPPCRTLAALSKVRSEMVKSRRTKPRSDTLYRRSCVPFLTAYVCGVYTASRRLGCQTGQRRFFVWFEMENFINHKSNALEPRTCVLARGPFKRGSRPQCPPPQAPPPSESNMSHVGVNNDQWLQFSICLIKFTFKRREG